MIRPERPEDHGAIRELHREAFGGGAEADLVDALRNDGHATISLVAEWRGNVVGHILFSPVKTSGTAHPPVLGLAPLAVLPSHQRLGLGSKLVREGLLAAMDLGASAVIVLGDPAYYGRFGFSSASARGLTSAFADGHPEAFQAVELVEGGLDGRRGPVTYAPAFGATLDAPARANGPEDR